MDGPAAPTVLTANEVTLQHCVLKAVLTVLDNQHGLSYVLSHEDVLASIFTAIQVYQPSFSFSFTYYLNIQVMPALNIFYIR